MVISIKKFEQLAKIVPTLTYQRIGDESSIVVSHDKLILALNKNLDKKLSAKIYLFLFRIIDFSVLTLNFIFNNRRISPFKKF
jgi:hypothetical protein